MTVDTEMHKKKSTNIKTRSCIWKDVLISDSVQIENSWGQLSAAGDGFNAVLKNRTEIPTLHRDI